MILILCHGGSRFSARLARATDTHYGTRDDYTIYAPPYFIDFNWKKPATPERWQRYMALIAQHKPHMAMSPDFESKAQWQTLKQQIVDVRRAGAKHVVVTPKYDGALAHIPRWASIIIGVSVPTSYAGYLPTPEALRGHNVHFLGGTPDQWAYLKRVYESSGARVISADGNFAVRKARDFGQYWRPDGGFAEMRGQGFSTFALARACVVNTKRYIDNPPINSVLLKSKRVQRCAQEIEGHKQLSLF